MAVEMSEFNHSSYLKMSAYCFSIDLMRDAVDKSDDAEANDIKKYCANKSIFVKTVSLGLPAFVQYKPYRYDHDSIL